MSNIVNTLPELTRGEFLGEIKKLDNFVVNAKFTDFTDLIAGCDTFYINSVSKELNLYKNKSLVYAACIQEVYSSFWVVSMYDKNGLVYFEPIDYTADYMRCAGDIYQLIAEYKDRYIYHLDDIYNKYRVDVTNNARFMFNF